MNQYIQRGLFLMRQNRYTDAKKELQQALGQEPQNAMIFALLAECSIQEDDGQKALEMATTALNLEAGHPYFHSVLAKAYMILKKYNDAQNAIGEAITLEPYNDTYYFIQGNIFYLQKNWEAALQAAGQALEINAESVEAINLRSLALVKLNRKEEATSTADYALHKEPENPYSHANKGWAELNFGNHKNAQKHFREALRLQPMHESARAGLKESIKAENIFYRQILKYFLWINRLSEKYQWGFIIGLYIVYRIILNIAESYPSIAPLMYPLIVAYIIFAFSTWIAVPVSNFFLRLHPLGKHALTPDEKLGSNLVSGFLITCIGFLIAYFITNQFFFMLMGGWFGFISLLIGPIFNASTGSKSRLILSLTTLGIGLIGLTAIFALPELTIYFFIGIFGYSFLANWLMMKDY